MDIALLGFGVMGKAVAERLTACGHQVRVYSRSGFATAECGQPAVAGNGPTAPRVKDAVAHAGIVLSFVTDDQASQDVWFGENGACTALDREAFCFECSTLSLDYIARWHRQMARFTSRHFDLPVTGSRKGALSGTLTGFLGGKLDALQPAAPYLAQLFCNIVELGEPGYGMALKLSYNMMSGVVLGGFIEGVHLAEALGISRLQAVESFRRVGVGRRIAEIKGAAVADRSFQDDRSDIFCSTAIFRKDLSYAQRASESHSLYLPLSETVCRLYQMAPAETGDLDYSSISLSFASAQLRSARIAERPGPAAAGEEDRDRPGARAGDGAGEPRPWANRDIHTLGPPGTDSDAVAKTLSRHIVLHPSFRDAMHAAFLRDECALVPCGYIQRAGNAGDASAAEDNWVSLNFRYADKMEIKHSIVRRTKPMCIAVRRDRPAPKTAVIHPATLYFLQQWNADVAVHYVESKPLAVELAAAGDFDACVGPMDLVAQFPDLKIVSVFRPQMVWCLYQRPTAGR